MIGTWLYASECWPLRREEVQRLLHNKRAFLNWILKLKAEDNACLSTMDGRLNLAPLESSIVYIGVPTPLFFFKPTPPLNLQAVQAPPRLFQAIPPYILVFREPLSKNRIFHSTPIIFIFFILKKVSSHLIKVTELFVKNPQFKFLVMTQKYIFVDKLSLSLNISDFSFFLCKNCNPFPWKNLPSFSLQLSSKTWDPVKLPLFENLVGGSSPHSAPKQRGRPAHCQCWG